jgi:hypothetical protein
VGAAGEGDALDVGERAVRGPFRAPVDGEIRGDLAVGARVGEIERAPDSAQQRRGDQDRRQVGDQPRDGQGETAALAVADGGHA